MFVNPNLKGNIAEAVIAAEATKLGIEVLKPQTEHTRHDLVFFVGGRFHRVQCKSGTRKGEAMASRLVGSRRSAKGFHRTSYSKSDVDLIAAYCDALDACYLIPIEAVEGMSAFQLRLSPARNGQQLCINLAAAYEFKGAVAQLARATGWQPVGRRFESDQLHHDENRGIERVGAERFGRHPARFLQRAAAGEEFLISRRGTPMARLCPVDAAAPLG